MARARNIKPGFFSNEDLAECSFQARLCFAGLWTLADREGRLEDRPKRIKGELFRFDSIEVEPLLKELEQHGFISRYTAHEIEVIQILEFLKHQHPHQKEPPSILPPYIRPGQDPPPMGTKPGALGSSMGTKPGALGSSMGTKPGAPPGSNGAEAPDKHWIKSAKVILPGGSNPAESNSYESGALNPEKSNTAPTGLVDQGASLAPDDPQPQLPGTEGKPRPYAVPDCPYDEVLTAYHAALAMLPSVTVLNDARREHMRARWREVCAAERFDKQSGVDWFRWFFGRVAESKFLTGRARASAKTGRPFKAGFDWLMGPTNFAKVIDGNFHDESVAL